MNAFKQRDNRDRDDRQMHSATCATCGVPVQVPFKPDGSRPIFCREHFGAGTQNTRQAPSGGPRRPFSGPREFSGKREFGPRRDFRPAPVRTVVQPAAPDPRIDEIQRTLAKLQVKLDQVLTSLAVSKALESAPAPAPAKKKKAAPKKK